MQQPDLGCKVTEMRKQKGLTQEQLAEACEVSTRTIQRIENGEVEPRAFTRNNLSNLLEFDFGENNTGNESVLAGDTAFEFRVVYRSHSVIDLVLEKDQELQD